MGKGLDEHVRLCRRSVDSQLEQVTEEAKRVREALFAEREAADERYAGLRGLLRQVQLEHSRALIILSKDLELDIIEAIGPPPRDVGE
jgi:hypothetical protein